MSTAQLNAAIKEIFETSPDPYGTVAKLLVSTFHPSVGSVHLYAQFIVIWIGLGITVIMAVTAIAVRYFRTRKASGNMVFLVRQENFVLPSSSLLFLIGMTLWAVLGMGYVWKMYGDLKGLTSEGGLQELRSLTWCVLQITGAFITWALVGAANLSPAVTRPVAGEEGKRTRNWLWLSPRNFNLVILIISIGYVVAFLIAGAMVAVRCEELNTVATNTIKTAVFFSEQGLTAADQTALGEFTTLANRMGTKVNQCLVASRAEFGLWGAINIIDGAGIVLGTTVIWRRIGKQIHVLERAAIDMRRARQTGLALERHNSDGQDGTFVVQEVEEPAFFPAYGSEVQHHRPDRPDTGHSQPGRQADAESITSRASKSSFGSGGGMGSLLRAGGNRIRDEALGRRTRTDAPNDDLSLLERRLEGMKEVKSNLAYMAAFVAFAVINMDAVCFLALGAGIKATTDPVIIALVDSWPFFGALIPGILIIGVFLLKAFQYDPTQQGGLLGNPVLAPAPRRPQPPRKEEPRQKNFHPTASRFGEESRLGTFSQVGHNLAHVPSHITVPDHTSSSGHGRSYDPSPDSSGRFSGGSQTAFLPASSTPATPTQVPTSMTMSPGSRRLPQPPGFTSSTPVLPMPSFSPAPPMPSFSPAPSVQMTTFPPSSPPAHMPTGPVGGVGYPQGYGPGPAMGMPQGYGAASTSSLPQGRAAASTSSLPHGQGPTTRATPPPSSEPRRSFSRPPPPPPPYSGAGVGNNNYSPQLPQQQQQQQGRQSMDRNNDDIFRLPTGGIDESPRAPQPNRGQGGAARPQFMSRRKDSFTSDSSGGGQSQGGTPGLASAGNGGPSMAQTNLGQIPSSRSTSNYSGWQGAR